MDNVTREGEVRPVVGDSSPAPTDGAPPASAAPSAESAAPPATSAAPQRSCGLAWGRAAQTWENAAPRPGTAPAADAALCDVCHTAAPSLSLVGSHVMCAGCAHQLNAQFAALQPTASGLVRGAIWGAALALLGAVVWAAFAITSGYEIGYAAVLVGVLAGVGVKRGAAPQSGRALQWLAVAVAVFGMLAAKYAMFSYTVVDLAQQHGRLLGYFDELIVSHFPGALHDMLGVLDLVFVALAVRAAYRVPRPSLRDLTVPKASVVSSR